MTGLTTKPNSLRDAFTKRKQNSSEPEWIQIDRFKFFVTDRFKETGDEYKCPLCGKHTTGFLGFIKTEDFDALNELGFEELMIYQGDHCCQEIALMNFETEIKMTDEELEIQNPKMKPGILDVKTEPEIQSITITPEILDNGMESEFGRILIEPNLVKILHDDITKKFTTDFIANTQEILPPGLLSEIEQLILSGYCDAQNVIQQIKNIQDDDSRLFALNVIHSFKDVFIEGKKEIFASFINDPCENIQYHMALFAGIYKIADCIPVLKEFTKKSNELIQCTSFWSLVRLEQYDGFTDKLAELLSKIQSELGFYYIIASLFLINCASDSKEMAILRTFYFTHFFDEENETFIQEIEHIGGEQLAVFISSLLLRVAYKIGPTEKIDANQLEWLIVKD